MEAAEARDRAPAPEAARARWRVRLLGAVEAEPVGAGAAAAARIVRWPTRAVAALLARLALAPHRTHAREELVELLWPGVSPEVGRNRLRQTLSTLKTLLETDGQPVLLADRLTVRVQAGALACDAVEFEHSVRRGDAAAARAAYQGALMPAHYEDWVITERERLASLHERLELAAPVAAPAAAPAPVVVPAGVAEPAPAAVHGLPGYLTRAFGLEDRVARLQAVVRAERLVTVHGPGGSGKTRLAASAAAALGGRPDSPFAWVVFVPLVACRTAEQALEAVAVAVGAAGVADAATRIQAALAGRAVLLVLDNAEQLEPRADAALAALLPALPRLHLVVTSRRLLGLDGERAFDLRGLALPDPDADAGAIAGSPAAALLVDRARLVLDDLALDAPQWVALASIVRLLSGMPLAIELAASRLRSLSPVELLEHLRAGGSATLDLLARHAQPASAVDTRHVSMRHVVAWSWALLSPAQRSVLQRLSVLDAPARLASVAAVTGLDDAEALGHLEQLHDLALVHRSADARRVTRWSLLQPVREFAAEQQPAEEARAARGRLRRWLIGDAAARPAGHDPADELVHVHAAIASSAADDAGPDALRLALALRLSWDDGAMPLYTLRALEQALQAPGLEPALRCDGHDLLSCARVTAGCSADALRHAQAAVDLAPDDRRRSLARSRWAWAAYYDGRYDADYDAVLDEAERRAVACGDVYAQAIAWRVRSLVHCNVRLDFARAEHAAVRAQALFERAGEHAMARSAHINGLMVKSGRGLAEEALTGLREIDAAMHAAGDWSGLVHSTRQRGRLLIGMRRFGEAVEALRASLRAAWRQHRMTIGLAHGLLHLPEALLHGSDADAEAAARLQGYAVLHWERLYPRLNRIEARELKRARRMLRRRLGGARAEALMLAGRSLSQPDALALALGAPAPG